MKSAHNPIIIIPARLASVRLPRKPLAIIDNVPMIVHSMRRAQESAITDKIVIACDSEEIAQVVIEHGGEAVLTDPDLPSGSDRVWAALQIIDAQEQHDIVINLQGDMPTLAPTAMADILQPFADKTVDITTLAAVMADIEQGSNPNIVKVVISDGNYNISAGDFADSANSDNRLNHNKLGNIGRAIYFSRSSIPYGANCLYQHVGVYAYRRCALRQFVELPQSKLEKIERLEQLRALEAGMHIAVSIIDSAPIGVDTDAQLQQVRQIMASRR